MQKLILPKGYSSSLNILETQKAIKKIKDFFQLNLAESLNLTRVSAPLFVMKSTGINDNLNGIETPVNFFVKDNERTLEMEIVQSLAKWKRVALKNYNIPIGDGIYTDMNAIRPCEECDSIHSIYVDQWDWEKVISKEDRTLDFLKKTVSQIYDVFLKTERMLLDNYEGYRRILKDELFFITTQELENLYPNLDPNEREYEICKEKGAVFLMQIGDKLISGKPHDGRSPDYDDWSLNGDLILWNPILENSLELSSMGIRVDPAALIEQLRKSNNMDRLKLEYHTLLTNGELPLTIGGGIGQSRICMFFLQKAHIGEVQSSIWPESMIRICEKNGINLL